MVDHAMQKQRKGSTKSKGPKPLRQRVKLAAAANPRLAAQTRKILGKHYASKYPTR